MKRVSYYLVAIVIGGVLITSFWVWNKYFRAAGTDITSAVVERGDIQEVVRARGEAVSQKEFNLEFPLTGTVSAVLVSEGQSVLRNAPLMRLDTTDLTLEARRLNAVLTQARANLDKLRAGVTLQDISVSEAQVASAQTALQGAAQTLSDAVTDAYAKTDDAVRTKIDPLFNNPRTNPDLSFSPNDPQVKIDIESMRATLEPKLKAWGASIQTLTLSSDLSTFSALAKTNLQLAQALGSKASLVLNNLAPAGALTQTTIDAWRSNVSLGRTAMSAAMTTLSAAQEKFDAARSALTIAQNELAVKRAGTRDEELVIAKAQVDEVQDEIAAVNEKIARSTLRAPADAKVTKIGLEKDEFAGIGKTAISLSIPSMKIQADISELDIGRIREGSASRVMINFDAFPSVPFTGSVLSIDSQEIVKEGDKYFRVNVLFEAATSTDAVIRAGMSADLILTGATKTGVLKIPEIAVMKSGNRRYVKVLLNGVQKEVEVKLGISDGDTIEITSGLNVGDVVLISGS